MNIEKDFDQMMFGALLDLNDTMNIGRNDYCYCESKKKYKKCCMQFQDLVDEDPAIQFSLNSLDDALYNDGRDPLPEDIMESLEVLHDKVLTIGHSSKEEQGLCLEELDRFITLYPKAPMLLNFLYIAYQLLDLDKDAEDLMHRIMTLFPNYFFGKINYAFGLLGDKKPEKAFAVFNTNSLQKAFPHRTVFDTSEGISFQKFLVEYYITTENITLAERHYRYLRNLLLLEDSDNAHHETFLFRQRINHLHLKKKIKAIPERIENLYASVGSESNEEKNDV